MKLDKIFSSHMVFAADLPIRIYGEGKGRVEVRLADNKGVATAQNGRWMAVLPPMPYGGPYTLTVTDEESSVTLEDIFIGRVLLCAGQSNMQFKIKETKLTEKGISPTDKIRLFVTKRIENTDRFKPDDGWVKANDDTVPDFTAVGYLVAERLAERDGTAVGIIGCYQGASMIESWVPADTYQKAGIAVPLDDKHEDYRNPEYSAWNGDGQLYEYSFRDIFPFSVSEVIWYQGESNSRLKTDGTYAKMLALMIDVWRKDLQSEELPFVIVQIADYIYRDDEGWRRIQRDQLKVQNMRENVTTVISADISESDTIHPPTKHTLAERIVGVLE